MIVLKEVKHYPDSNSVEATWVDRIQLPDVEVPESDAVLDEDGNVTTPAVEAHTVPGEINEITVKCHSYADVQMDMLRADLGADAADYADLIATVEAGIVPPPPKPIEVLQAEIVASTQSRLDAFARTRNYDGILSACTYATSTIPQFATEGQYCVTARDATWAALYQIMAEVQGGTRPVPASYEDIEGDLPVLEWPV